MAQTSWPWQGNAVGDAVGAPWDEDNMSDFFRYLLTPRDEVQIFGVLPNRYGGNLLVTNPSGVIINVEPGAGICYGSLYENTANVEFTIAAPGVGSNYYTMMLQKSWTNKEVVLALVGPSAVAYPTETRTPGTLYEVKIAEIDITSVGVVSVNDRRRFLASNGTTTPPWLGRLGPDYGMTAVNWNQAQDYNTQFGGAVNNHTGRAQGGTKRWSGGAASSGNVAITFPVEFSGKPNVIVQVYGTDAGIVLSQNPSTTGTTIYWLDAAGSTHTQIDFMWCAFGPIVRGN